MGEPSSGPQEGTPRTQTPSMLSLYLERSQIAQSQTSEPEQALFSLPAASEPASEPPLRPLLPSSSLESIPVGALPALSEAASTSQSPFFRSHSQALPASQSYLLPQQPQTTAASASISAVSSSLSLGSLPRQPGAALPTIQSARCARTYLLKPHRFARMHLILVSHERAWSPVSAVLSLHLHCLQQDCWLCIHLRHASKLLRCEPESMLCVFLSGGQQPAPLSALAAQPSACPAPQQKRPMASKQTPPSVGGRSRLEAVRYRSTLSSVQASLGAAFHSLS